MDDDRSLVPSRGSTYSAAMTVPIQDYFPKATKMRFILPVKRVAGRTHPVREDSLSSASTVHYPLSSLLHAFTLGFALPIYL